QMETSTQSRVGGGLWNNPRATQYSKETQDMLRYGAPLPLTSDSTASASPPQPKASKSVQRRLPGKPQKRSAETCRSGSNYTREKFRPGPIRDLEKEKRRLQNILATGKDEPTPASSENVPTRRNEEVEKDKDQFQEVLDEIQERRQFLEHMASLGQEKKYIDIINTEISQKIRELEVLEKKRGANKDALTSEKEALAAEQKT
ncbi:UPF0193 protein EVG1-like protein, partial [Nibea albiflora]